MSKEEILDNNELIAKFLKLKSFEVGKTGKMAYIINKEDYGYKAIDLDYHKSWGKLMPVIEKIESISELSKNRKCNFHVTIEKHRCFIKWGIGYTICDINDYNNSKISIVYEAVIEFIKWYNQNKLNETN